MIPIRNDLSMAAAEPWPDGMTGGPALRPWNDPGARLSEAEYAGWLLPPAPRDAVERLVHALSLTAGIGAVTAFSVALWLVA